MLELLAEAERLGAELPVSVAREIAEILDDVLMAFDDARTGAALLALRDLSRKTQVLVFTHRGHHVELAEKVLGFNSAI